MSIVLRPDQFDLQTSVKFNWELGNKNVIAVLPTGGGKSIIVSDLVRQRDAEHRNQCVIAHRRELVGQMSMHVARAGVHHRVIGPRDVIAKIIADHREEFGGYSYINHSARCAVAGVDTLVSRKDELKDWAKQIHDWTIDEAHHVLRGNKWGNAVEMFPNANGLGVTASPARADGMGLGRHADGVFDVMVQGPTMRQLINMRALCDYEIAIPPSDFHIDDADFGPTGDLSPQKGREASKRSHIVGDVVKEYIKRAYGKRGITFATDVETANEIAAQFNLAGVPAVAISAKTHSSIRDRYIRDFRAGRIWQLVNVDLFGEGFDLPAVEVVSMARPTASLAVYLQQFGRALRVLAGKLYGLIIDHVSNWKRHGFPDKVHRWMLDRREKRAKQQRDPEDIELTTCRNVPCGKPYEKFRTCCPYCGWVPPLPESSKRSIEIVEGDLVLLDRETIERMQKATILDTPASVGHKAGYVAGTGAAAGAINRQIERIQAQQRLVAAMGMWAGKEKAMGRFEQRETEKRFFLTTGVDVLTAQSLPRVEMDKLTAQIEGWLR